MAFFREVCGKFFQVSFLPKDVVTKNHRIVKVALE